MSLYYNRGPNCCRYLGNNVVVFICCVNGREGVRGLNCQGKGHEEVRSLTEPPAEAAEVTAAAAVAEEADEVPSEVGAAAAVGGGAGGGAVPPSVEDVVDEVEAVE